MMADLSDDDLLIGYPMNFGSPNPDIKILLSVFHHIRFFDQQSDLYRKLNYLTITNTSDFTESFITYYLRIGYLPISTLGTYN